MKENHYNVTTDKERAFYGKRSLSLSHCRIDGPADGESAVKECEEVRVDCCKFNLRYPFWHTHWFFIRNSDFTENCRAPFWYATRGNLTDCYINGVKAFRECKGITITETRIRSDEFGWFSEAFEMRRVAVIGEYFMLRSKNLNFDNVNLDGKYSFQYVEDAKVKNSMLKTKDAFWHAKNVLVKDCDIRGEYLGWYSENLTLVNCKITGTQPLCYCKNLKLIDCEMINCDRAFEKSDVTATITSPVVSIKNPASGRITVPSVVEIIRDDPDSFCEVVTASSGDSRK